MNITEKKISTSAPDALYPIKFEPIWREMIWGGEKISQLKQLKLPQKGIGESWEISGLSENPSVVANGFLSGKTLIEIIQIYKNKLVGGKVYDTFGDIFPLLIKFIDAQKNLSIQVHPNDKLAKERHNSFGKTEMWYVVQASPTAFLYSGFATAISAQDYPKKVEDNTFTDALKRFDVNEGDVFFLPAGRVHAIGAGCLVAEIQQTSDITYRIYDYNRKDQSGNMRQLHVQEAIDAVNFDDVKVDKIAYTNQINNPVELVTCSYFTTNLIETVGSMQRDYSALDSFVAYICVDGNGVVKDDKNNAIAIGKGETILLPAETYRAEISSDNRLKILETFVQ